MLRDMLTARNAAAAKHGLEHPPLLLLPPPPPPPPSSRAASPASNGSFLIQMPLSILTSYLRQQSPSPLQPPATATTIASHGDPTRSPDTTPIRHVVINGAHITSPPHSRPPSSGSSAADHKRQKQPPRSKTSYLIAKPAQPVHARSKLYIRPKVILQLHQVIPDQRPKPVYEIIPFALCPLRSTRRLARTFNTTERLGPHDLLVVEAETYTTKDEDSRSDEERWATREVIGVMSGKCDRSVVGRPEICMNDGMSRWEVTDMPNGGYEFKSTDDHGLVRKARWVRKPVNARRASNMSIGPQHSPTFASGQEDKKYTFSTMTANSRRHPIIATMTSTRIDVMDNYIMPSATSPPTPAYSSHSQSPVLTPSGMDLSSFMDKAALLIETDNALRQLIVVSGLWVASQTFCSSDVSSQPPTPTLNSSATYRSSIERTVSMSFLDTPRSTSPASTIDEQQRSIPRLFRRSMGRLPRSTSFTEAPPSPSSTRRSSNASPASKTRPRRANSTGTTELPSMTGSMRKRHGLAFENQALPETEEERQIKRSEELTRIKELVLPSPVEKPSIDIATTHVKVTQSRPSILSPVILPPPSNDLKSPAPHLSPPTLPSSNVSPPFPHPEHARKTQSAYNPITTAGMWDSGVTQGPGLKRRPTSIFVMNERKRKEERKNERRKSKDSMIEERVKRDEKSDGYGLKRKGDWYIYKIKLQLKGLIHREKA